MRKSIRFVAFLLCLPALSVVRADLIFYEAFEGRPTLFVKNLPDWDEVDLGKRQTNFVIDADSLVAPENVKLKASTGQKCVVVQDHTAAVAPVRRRLKPVGLDLKEGMDATTLYVSFLINVEKVEQNAWAMGLLFDSQIRDVKGRIRPTTENCLAFGKTNRDDGKVRLMRFMKSPVGQPVEFSAGKTHFLVAKYDFVNQAAMMWVNPVCGQPEGDPASRVEFDKAGENVWQVKSLDSFALYVGAFAKDVAAQPHPGKVQFDEIRLGTTWEDVTPTDEKN